MLHAERFGRGESFVIAANHESFYDILVLLAAPADDDLASSPSATSSGCRFSAGPWRPPVSCRSTAASARRGGAIVDAALKRAGKGASLIVFPEETRTRTGELLPFKAGAALLAIRSGLPILPIGIGGTFGILRRGGFTITPSEVAIAVGEPIPVAGLSSRDRGELTERLRERVEALRAEARAAVAYNPVAERR